MSWGAREDETPRTADVLAAERRWLERKGEAGEQPEEPPCRCPRNCWCQGDSAEGGLIREGLPYKASHQPCVVCGRGLSVPASRNGGPAIWACVSWCLTIAEAS